VRSLGVQARVLLVHTVLAFLACAAVSAALGRRVFLVFPFLVAYCWWRASRISLAVANGGALVTNMWRRRRFATVDVVEVRAASPALARRTDRCLGFVLRDGTLVRSIATLWPGPESAVRIRDLVVAALPTGVPFLALVPSGRVAPSRSRGRRSRKVPLRATAWQVPNPS
jgi:hypothetical protein